MLSTSIDSKTIKLAIKIKQRRKELGISQRELAAKSGISFGSIQKFESGTNPTAPNLLKLARILECSIDWLMDYIVEEKPGHGALDGESVVAVTRISSRLISDGSLKVVGHTFFSSEWLKNLGDNGNFLIMRISGDTMDPTLREGDWLLIDNTHTSIMEGGIYAIKEGENILVKRLQPLLGGNFMILSDNDKYPPQTWNSAKEPLQLIGRAVWTVNILVPSISHVED